MRGEGRNTGNDEKEAPAARRPKDACEMMEGRLGETKETVPKPNETRDEAFPKADPRSDFERQPTDSISNRTRWTPKSHNFDAT